MHPVSLSHNSVRSISMEAPQNTIVKEMLVVFNLKYEDREEASGRHWRSRPTKLDDISSRLRQLSLVSVSTGIAAALIAVNT